MPTLLIYTTARDTVPTETLPLGSAHAFTDIITLLDRDGGHIASTLTAQWDETGAQLNPNDCATMANLCDIAANTADDRTANFLTRIAETLRNVPPSGCAVIT